LCDYAAIAPSPDKLSSDKPAGCHPVKSENSREREREREREKERERVAYPNPNPPIGA